MEKGRFGLQYEVSYFNINMPTTEEGINANRMNLKFDNTFSFYPASDAAEAAELIGQIFKKELGTALYFKPRLGRTGMF